MRPIFSLSLLLSIILSACAGTAGGNLPTAPSDMTPQKISGASSPHTTWGIWDVTISEDLSTVDVVPVRSAELHLNVVRLLEVSPCPNCITFTKPIKTGPDMFDIDVTLRHPFPGMDKYAGFDVRGIFIAQADYAFPPTGRSIGWGNGVPRLVNCDGYTSLFNPVEFPTDPLVFPALRYFPGKKATGGDLSATLNPFLAYQEDAERRLFPSGAADTRTYTIQAPQGSIHFGYVVDASWMPVDKVTDPLTDFPLTANCIEAYKIEVNAGPVHSDGTPDLVQVKVWDHQGLDTIKSVSAFSPQLFDGEVAFTLQPNTGEPYALFTGTISDNFAAPCATYPLLIRVVDNEIDPNLGPVDAWQVYPAEVKPFAGWAITWGDTGDDQGYQVRLDKDGNIYVCGGFMGTVDFDPGPGVDLRTSNGGFDASLTKFDPEGNYVWARTWGGITDDFAYALDVDPWGNAYITGNYQDTVDFGNGSGAWVFTSNGFRDIYLCKLDTNGEFQWVRTFGGNGGGSDDGQSITVDDYGNVYVTGDYWGTVDFDPGPADCILTANGWWDVFLSKFDHDGVLVWAKSFGGIDAEAGWYVTTYNDFVFVTGEFKETVDFDPGPGDATIPTNGDKDAFLSKFNPADGSLVWARGWGGSAMDEGHSIDFDELGNIYVVGVFSGTADLDPGPGVDNHVSGGNTDPYVSKLDSNGNFLWARGWGGPNEDRGYSVAYDNFGSIFVTGRYTGNVDLDPGPGEDLHNSVPTVPDVSLSKFGTDGTFAWGVSWGGGNYTFPCYSSDEKITVVTDSVGNAYITGKFESTTDFNPGPGVEEHSANGGTDAFLSKVLPTGSW